MNAGIFLRHIDCMDGQMEVTVDADFVWVHAGAFTLFLAAGDAKQLIHAAGVAMHDDQAEPAALRLLSGDELEVSAQHLGAEPRLWISSGPAHLSPRFAGAQLLIGALSEACEWLRKNAASNKEAGRC